MKTNNIKQKLFYLFIVLLLTACGSSTDTAQSSPKSEEAPITIVEENNTTLLEEESATHEESIEDNNSEENLSSSISTTTLYHLTFIDSPVVNLTYECGDKIARTDNEGNLSCASFPITFSALDIEIGELQAMTDDHKVYPQDLVGVSREATSNTEVQKIASFLQSLDDDGDVSQFIVISDTNQTQSKQTQSIQQKRNLPLLTNMSSSEMFAFLRARGFTPVALSVAEQNLRRYGLGLVPNSGSSGGGGSSYVPPTRVNQAPIANAGENLTTRINHAITIIGTARDNDGVISSYMWKKGDTVLATTASFSYMPTVEGNETLTFIVTDNDGAIDSDEINITAFQAPFITTWKTDNILAGQQSSTDDNQIKIGTNSDSGIYNYNIDCDGDGIDEATRVTGDYICTYPVAGTYTVKISGEFPQIYFSDLFFHDSAKLISIEQWGDIQWKSMEKAFANCLNLVGNTTDKPNLSDVTNMSYMFANTKFSQDIGDWNVSTITDMSYMFLGAREFNQDISSWNVSNVMDMSGMFFEAYIFNQDITQWDVSNVTNMNNMFHDAKLFNQAIGNWDVSNVIKMGGSDSSWEHGMFEGATSFNQDLSQWNISKVTDMTDIFKDSNLSIQNYDAILNAWSQLVLQHNVPFGAGTIKYSLDANASRQSLIDDYNWTITDGGVIVEGGE